MEKIYDVIIIGGGISGSFIASELTQKGLSCLMLEAGKFFSSSTFPKRELDGNSQLYWGGGIELNQSASLALLRPKAVGGGSIVNQALLDRFDDLAWSDWKSTSEVSFFDKEQMAIYYDQAEKKMAIQEIDQKYRNKNAEVFFDGFKNNGYQLAPLRRAQKNCDYENGNDCVECLNGCRANSKQSMVITTLKEAIKNKLDLLSEFEVTGFSKSNDVYSVYGNHFLGKKTFWSKKIVLASGAVGNSKLLLNLGYGNKSKSIGKNFYTHPQFMVLAEYKEIIDAQKGALQSYKSADLGFRKSGFKLENVFAQAGGISMMLPGFAKEHMDRMKKIRHLACIEVAIRDTNPGEILLTSNKKVIIKKELNTEDKARKKRGMEAIQNIYTSTGALNFFEGKFGVGLHLMGGLSIGVDANASVVSPEFSTHFDKNIFVADSSIFPNAPGINPSLTIMALSMKASQNVVRSFK